MRRAWIGSALACALAAASLVVGRPREHRPRAPVEQAAAPLGFVGSAACGSCHAREAALWRGSHHQLAMQPASEATVLGDFHDARFERSRFFRRDGKFLARIDGPDGALHDYAITDTFGVSPLQQYLVAFPGGRFQALEIAWDTAGQRWFHLHPGEKPGEEINARDPLHWTGAAGRWNFMCADCHSTNVRKRWASGEYSTRFAEISVGCEACHGPGSRHAAAPAEPLPIALDERQGVSFVRDAAGVPHRSSPRPGTRELEMCARCHSRRGLVHEDHVHGQPLGDDYQVALLDEDLYWPDGQIKGEVYEYGSFVQSRMFAEGVTCSDCHDPHRPTLAAAGDALCLRCHAERYASTRHHFHHSTSCVDCHMPTTTFMGVDARRDHSLRVPRPDLTVKLGVPNACNRCHAERSPAWAARTVERWYGHVPSGFQRFAEALAAGNERAPGAEQLLGALAVDRAQPAIARASAVERMARLLGPTLIPALRAALDDPDALVRRAAAETLGELPAEVRALASPLLSDPVRSVRVAAASSLAGLTLDSPPERAALERATVELFATWELGADRPEAHLARARYHTRRGQFDRAEAELGRAISLEPAFVPAAVNLADLYRALGRDAEGEAVLRAALERAPAAPALRHALGLWLVRQHRPEEALSALEEAARRDPDDARFSFVYAVALHDLGRRREAVERLRAVLVRHPGDRDSLAALAAFR